MSKSCPSFNEFRLEEQEKLDKTPIKRFSDVKIGEKFVWVFPGCFAIPEPPNTKVSETSYRPAFSSNSISITVRDVTVLVKPYK